MEDKGGRLWWGRKGKEGGGAMGMAACLSYGNFQKGLRAVAARRAVRRWQEKEMKGEEMMHHIMYVESQ